MMNSWVYNYECEDCGENFTDDSGMIQNCAECDSENLQVSSEHTGRSNFVEVKESGDTIEVIDPNGNKVSGYRFGHRFIPCTAKWKNDNGEVHFYSYEDDKKMGRGSLPEKFWEWANGIGDEMVKLAKDHHERTRKNMGA